MRLLTIGIIALALVPAAGSAQSTIKSPASAFTVAPAAASTLNEAKGPTIESAAVGVRTAPTSVDAAALRARARKSSGIGHAGALMVVGGGAMVAATFMDGEPQTFFMVGGAIIALYGLYLFVQ
jgi:hypothetical protein